MLINAVAPFAGAWIEIGGKHVQRVTCKSLPSRERGLKSQTPVLLSTIYTSLPSRERGLKWNLIDTNSSQTAVAPFAGAWIEIRGL